MSSIPIIIIAYNNLTFVQNFIRQIYNLTNSIIVIDNCSTYKKQHEWYDSLNDPKITLHRLDKNYSHKVVYELKKELNIPDIFVLSDPDLELNPNMPDNVIEILEELSEKYKVRRVGLSISVDSYEEFIEGEYRDVILYHGYKYRSKPTFENEKYIIKEAPTDTTFALHNFKYHDDFNKNLWIFGDFECKHLPWYKNYLINNIPKDELREWLNNNVSSSILQYIRNDIINYINS